MPRQGDVRNINGVPHTYVNGKWVAVGEMGPAGGGLSGGYVGSGQSGAIGGILGVTGPTESASGKAAIDRLTNQADRRDCNGAGGFYTLGGKCLTGEEAKAQVNKILNNPNAPSALVEMANKWVENNEGDYDQWGWIQDFINIFRPYIEDQDVDDIDRIYRQEEADAFIDLLDKVQRGEATLDDLKNFEFEYLSEIPGWNDYYNGIIGGEESKGPAPRTWEEIAEILRENGYSEEEIEDIRDSIRDGSTGMQGSLILPGILRDLGYEDGDWWGVRPAAGTDCDVDGKLGTYDQDGNCIPSSYQPGDKCTSWDGSDGVIDENGDCKVDETEGALCVTEDGEPGKRGPDGDCIPDELEGTGSCDVITEENAERCGVNLDEWVACGDGTFAPTEEQCGEGTEDDPYSGLYDKYGKPVVDKFKDLYNKIKDKVGECSDPDNALDCVEDFLEVIYPTLSDECISPGKPGDEWIRDCITVGVILTIPGIDFPLPGTINPNATVGEIEDAMKEAGRSIEDFLEDPIGTIKEVFGDIWDKIKDIWESTEDKTHGNLIRILTEAGYGYIVGILGDKLEDEIIPDVTNPLLPITVSDCSKDDVYALNNEECDRLFEQEGWVLCEQQVDEQGNELSGGWKASVDECDQVGQFPDENGCTEGTWDGEKCVCPDGFEEDIDGTCGQEIPVNCEDLDYAMANPEECKETLCSDPQFAELNPELCAEPIYTEECPDVYRQTNEDGSCADECIDGYEFDDQGVCVLVECSNGATVESGCEVCPDGSRAYEHEGGICPTGVPEETCANGAEDFPDCGSCPEGQEFDEEGMCVPSTATPSPTPTPGGGGGGGGSSGGGGGGGGGFTPTPFSQASAGVVGNFPLEQRLQFPVENFLANYLSRIQQPQIPTDGDIVGSLFEDYI